MLSKLLRTIRSDEGISAVEYGLLAALIAIVIIAAVYAVGTGLSGTFGHVAGHLP